MSKPGYCSECQNTGFVECYCGGDLCVCGEEEIDCPMCGGASAEFACDEIEEGFDAGEWNNPPKEPKP